jgi:hypothetical protein
MLRESKRPALPSSGISGSRYWVTFTIFKSLSVNQVKNFIFFRPISLAAGNFWIFDYGELMMGALKSFSFHLSALSFQLLPRSSILDPIKMPPGCSGKAGSP